MIKLISLEKVSLEELTDSFNLCWQNAPDINFNPPNFTVEHLQAYLHVNCISLPNSVGLSINQQLVGFSFLGIIVRRGWLASLGIIPEFRGRGLSKLLLNHQLLISDTLNLLCTTLEVQQDSFMAEVYQSFGFQFYRKLANFVLAKNDLPDLDENPSYAARCRGATSKPYFNARNSLEIPFAWRRQEKVLNNYHNIAFYLSPDRASGYALQNSNKILLDIWSRSRAATHSALSSVFGQLDTALINNQIHDDIYLFLKERRIHPINLYAEMIRPNLIR